MSLFEVNRFASRQAPVPEEVAYPAEFHFRIIVEIRPDVEAALHAAVAGYQVTSPVTASRGSASGRYQAYSVSVEIRSRTELHDFDAAVKQVPGVRMLL